jgi:hypothetical protein
MPRYKCLGSRLFGDYGTAMPGEIFETTKEIGDELEKDGKALRYDLAEPKYEVYVPAIEKPRAVFNIAEPTPVEIPAAPAFETKEAESRASVGHGTRLFLDGHEVGSIESIGESGARGNSDLSDKESPAVATESDRVLSEADLSTPATVDRLGRRGRKRSNSK